MVNQTVGKVSCVININAAAIVTERVMAYFRMIHTDIVGIQTATVTVKISGVFHGIVPDDAVGDECGMLESRGA